jgi:hypothetical protein
MKDIQKTEAKALVTGSVLKWCRELAGKTLPMVAAKLKVHTDNIRDWEAGTDYPTLEQAEELAGMYEVCFAAFFLPKPPEDITSRHIWQEEHENGCERKEFAVYLGAEGVNFCIAEEHHETDILLGWNKVQELIQVLRKGVKDGLTKL